VAERGEFELPAGLPAPPVVRHLVCSSLGGRGSGEGVDSQGRVTSLLSGAAAAGLFYDGKCAGESCC
jgi:hypothetical protein